VLRRYLRVKATKPEEKGGRESERSILPMKQGNLPEGTLWREGGAVLLEPLEGKMQGTLRPESVSTGLQRVATLSKEAPEMVWTTLAHHIDLELLKEAYRLTRKDGAVGVDGQRAKEYEENLEENLRDLLKRFKAGTYKAPPVRRVYIPKGDGKRTRPIGIPTFEDKVLQRAVAMVLEAVYEQDFLDASYGFRPNRSAHQAIHELWRGTMRKGGGYVLELDIEKCFDTLDHRHLRGFLDKRVRDGVIRKAIDKWLKAGVLEEGTIQQPESGTPQGGVISPLLANIYLHEVLDKWFEQEVKPRLLGEAFLIRYADDAVMVFYLKADADRVFAVLPKRFGKFGLTLHPDKTRLVRFTRPGGGGKNGDRLHPGSFDFLGFTHYWGKGNEGRWVVKRKTAQDRFTKALKRISEWCRRHLHLPVKDQHRLLVLKLRGHDQYYGIRGNSPAVARFHHEVRAIWRKWLDRRSQRCKMTWERFTRFCKRYPLPLLRIAASV
jgi:group II intron reverse transcriptase/maturase